MAKGMKLPELGENITAAQVVSVLVKAGQEVKKDQPVLEVETDKATAEVPAPFDGVVREILVKPGDEVQVGQTVLTIDAAGEPPAATAASPEVPAGASDAQPAVREAARPRAVEALEPRERAAAPGIPSASDLVPAAPSVRRMARELGVDIHEVQGSGPAGRISAEDVKGHVRRVLSERDRATTARAEPPAAAELPDFSRWGDVEHELMSNIRRKTAEKMALSWKEIPHVTQFDRADITELEELRKRFARKAEAAGGRLTITAIVVRVAASALKVFPKFNASIDMARHEIVYKRYVNVGVAVDTEHGLLVPVIRDVDRKNIIQIAVALTDLAERARSRKIALDELRGGTFSVTNLGGLGTTYFSPIVNWPEVAVLGIGRAETQAVYTEGRFEPRLILPLSLSYDHRIIDGADASRFLRWIAEALEQPLLLALEG